MLLIAILLPVVTTMRKRGQQAKCVSNLRQVGLALEIYNQINHELPENTAAAAWADGLVQLRAATPQLFRCPSDDLNQIDYAMNVQFAGLPKSAGKASDVLASESNGRANALYFDGHAELAAAGN